MSEPVINLNELDKSNWKTYRFDEIASSISKRIDPTTTDLDIYIGLEHLDSGSIHIKRQGKRDDVSGQKLRFYPGDVIFARRRAYQRKAGIATTDGFCSAHSLVLRANTDVIDPQLLPFFLHSDLFMHRAVDISVGSLSPTINWGTLRKQQFKIPPRSQQLDHARLLSALDNLLLTRQALVNSLEVSQSVFFEHRMASDRNNRKVLRDVLIDIFAGKSPKGDPRPANADEHGVLKVSAVGDGVYVESENKCLVDQTKFDQKYEVKPGFILVTRANANLSGIGRPCVVSNTRNGLMLSDKTLRLIPKSELICGRFLFQLLRTKAYRNYVESAAGGTEAKNISQKLLGEAPIWVPEAQVQDEVVLKLEAMDMAISESKRELEALVTLRASILEKVF